MKNSKDRFNGGKNEDYVSKGYRCIENYMICSQGCIIHFNLYGMFHIDGIYDVEHRI